MAQTTSSAAHTLLSDIEGALQHVIPNVVLGVFALDDALLRELPPEPAATLAPYRGWTVVAFAVPITDEGLWVWHHHGSYRSLMANYVLDRAAAEVQRRLPPDVTAVDLPALTNQGVSMSEVGARAGLGTRGWNNLLLHPTYGSWLQIHALLIDRVLPSSPLVDGSVCIKCSRCIDACPVNALEVDRFHPERCRAVVASPWKLRSRAVALTANTYVECRACIDSCPIGTQPEGLFAWKR